MTWCTPGGSEKHPALRLPRNCQARLHRSDQCHAFCLTSHAGIRCALVCLQGLHNYTIRDDGDFPSFSLPSFDVCACRRHIQLQSTSQLSLRLMAHRIAQEQGVAGFYRGFIPSAVKNLPNKGGPIPPNGFIQRAHQYTSYSESLSAFDILKLFTLQTGQCLSPLTSRAHMLAQAS